MTKAVFLDRDGVINQLVPGFEGPDSPRSVEEFRLLPGVGRAIRKLNDLGLPVVLVSNQPGVAKGKYPVSNLDAMTERMKAALGEERAALQGIYYCMHHPEAVVADYRKDCGCRKPKSGLLTQAAAEMGLILVGSYMVGDQSRDMIAGKSVGCTTMFVDSADLPDKPGEADHVCRDLEAAAQLIARFEAVGVASR
jgi:D-glycero-D-manno-heptose 1,7-bisphosphate phosphatase